LGPSFHFLSVTQLVALGMSEAHVFKALYEIPLCVSFVFLVVQILRVTAANVLNSVTGSCQDDSESRYEDYSGRR
jgi:hypothetical protein